MLDVKNYRNIKTALSALFLTTVILVTTGFTSTTTSLEKCLDDQPNETQACLGKNSKHITLGSCYDQANLIKSNYLKENVRSYCFYHISEFPNLRTCVSKARLFTDAENHDAALFNCYSQFESGINKSSCETMAKLFRFPEKGRHLKSNCENLQ
ncbi:MAG: hypothetical protein V4654_10480 [Bdellovibrionota bacterium]